MKTKQQKYIILLLFIISLLMGALLTINFIQKDMPIHSTTASKPSQNEGKVFDKNSKPAYEKFELGLEMVRIPGQNILMGNYDGNPEGTEDELPAHEVRINEFLISKYEITQKQFERVMGTFPSFFKSENLPVTNVDWYDAIKFCNALSRKEGFQECYNINYRAGGGIIDVSWNSAADGYRLPTEAEYECAAQFDFNGQPLDAERFGWFIGNGERKTHNVGQKEANKYGLYDIIGNVWEWCWDIYGPFEQISSDNPLGALSGENRVAKGGSYTTENSLVRASERGNGKPTLKGKDLGMRVVRNKL